jgi:4-hydroxy-tetrahydrodipicolinate synthase
MILKKERRNNSDMNNDRLPKPLRGIIPPMITPLHDNKTLDVKGVERLIEHILEGGVHGLFILGTTGESPGLSYSIRYELIERVCKQVNQRVPVLVGITDTSFVESLNTAEKAAENGADAVVLAPPYYFASAQPELLEYLSHMAKQLPLPMFLYNMPTHTKIMIEPSTVAAAAQIPGIIGIKDSSANLAYLSFVQHILRNNPEFSLLVGPEEITAHFVLMGGHGGVNGGANMFPKLYVDLYNAAVNKEFDKIQFLQQKVMEVYESFYIVGKYGSSLLKGIKCVLSLIGICDDFLAEPFHRFKQEERNRIRENLQKIDIGIYKKEIKNDK